MKYILAALGAVAARQDFTMVIDPMHPKNFLTVPVAEQILKNSAYGMEVTGNKGIVSWSPCSADYDTLEFDESMSSYAPHPLSPGNIFQLNIGGIVNDSSAAKNIKNFHVHAEWSHTPLYDEDNAVSINDDSTFLVNLQWNCPSYAPLGPYEVQFHALDAAGKKHLCVSATMEL